MISLTFEINPKYFQIKIFMPKNSTNKLLYSQRRKQKYINHVACDSTFVVNIFDTSVDWQREPLFWLTPPLQSKLTPLNIIKFRIMYFEKLNYVAAKNYNKP